MNSPDLLRLESVNYRVNSGNEQLNILENINLDLHAGESVAITGVSGSGKTSLLTLMAGLESPTSGKIILSGREISHLSEDERASLRAKHIGFIFQAFHLLPNLTALENVMLPLEMNGWENAEEVASGWLNRVQLSHRLHHFPWQLSGGEQQRVAIARAFAGMPTLLFADEPTGNLDNKTGQTIIDLLFELNQKHTSTLVVVTHDDHLAKRCHRHWRLEEGRLLC